MKARATVDRQVEELTRVLVEEMDAQFETIPTELLERLRSRFGQILSQSKASLTPPEVASELGVSPDKVLHWIRTGDLQAMNAATSVGGRPRYRIDRSAIEAFKRRRANHSPAPTPVRRKTTSADVIEFF